MLQLEIAVHLLASLKMSQRTGETSSLSVAQRLAFRDPGGLYFFIIDEFNRDNLSKILGELMQLIEADKRGPTWQTRPSYATAGDPDFYVPKNLNILGMMMAGPASRNMPTTKRSNLIRNSRTSGFSDSDRMYSAMISGAWLSAMVFAATATALSRKALKLPHYSHVTWTGLGVWKCLAGLSEFEGEMRSFLEALLTAYEILGVDELALSKIGDFLKVKYGGTNGAKKVLGQVPTIRQAYHGYSIVSVRAMKQKIGLVATSLGELLGVLLNSALKK